MIRRTSYPGASLSIQTTPNQPRALSDSDPRLKPAAIVTAIAPYLRGGDVLTPIDPAEWPTAQAEVEFPALVMSPGPLVLMWNRVQIFQVDSPTPGDGEFYLYRTDASAPPVVQRARLGRNPDPGDKITAIVWIVDVTEAST